MGGMHGDKAIGRDGAAVRDPLSGNAALSGVAVTLAPA